MKGIQHLHILKYIYSFSVGNNFHMFLQYFANNACTRQSKSFSLRWNTGHQKMGSTAKAI